MNHRASQRKQQAFNVKLVTGGTSINGIKTHFILQVAHQSKVADKVCSETPYKHFAIFFQKTEITS
uniref:Uncharacterized protein n=1 Tax=Anguilla anguilla TaxID=7936 RepID=A0A0E9QA30_ANGAN